MTDAMAVNRQRQRDVMLGWSALILIASVSLLAAADVLSLIESVESDQFAGFQVASACKLLLDVTLSAAFACAAAALLFGSTRRSRRLERGAIVAAGGATIGVIGGAIATAVGVNHHLPSTYIAILASLVAVRVASVFAAVSASTAFAIACQAGDDAFARRDRRLAWAGLGVAISYSVAVITQLLYISYTSSHGASTGFAAGVATAAAGAAVATGAAVIGALAFYVSQRRRREDRIGWLSERDAGLGLAMTVFMCAFLLMGLGAVLQTVNARGLDASATAQLILIGVSSLGNAAASLCAAMGFAKSRQSSPKNPIGTVDLQAQ